MMEYAGSALEAKRYCEPPRHAHRFQTLDGLRGVAAAAVMLLHIGFMVRVPMARAGYLGVDLFFSLSGFVIAYNYSARIAAGLDWLSFLRIRIARLYPVYCVGLAISSSFLVVQSVAAPARHSFYRLAMSIAFGLLFLPTVPVLSIEPRWAFPINIPAWSLFFELAAGLVFVGFARKPSSTRLVLMLAVSFVLLAATVAALGTIEVGPQCIDLIGGFPRSVFAFFTGVLAWRLWRRRTAPLPVHPAFWLVLLAVFFAVCPRHVAPIELACSFAGFPLLVYAAASTREPGRAASSLFGWLGRLSYPAYAVQGPIFAIVEVLDRRSHLLWRHRLPSIAGLVGLVLMTAFVVERYFDIPVRKWMKQHRRSYIRTSSSPY